MASWDASTSLSGRPEFTTSSPRLACGSKGCGNSVVTETSGIAGSGVVEGRREFEDVVASGVEEWGLAATEFSDWVWRAG